MNRDEFEISIDGNKYKQLTLTTISNSSLTVESWTLQVYVSWNVVVKSCGHPLAIFTTLHQRHKSKVVLA